MNKFMSFGAVLWDIEGNNKTIGGAPFNLAAHLARMGVETYLYTKVGRDEYGKGALKEMKRLGIRTAYVQEDSFRETGFARVMLDEKGIPSYRFCKNAAHELIEASEKAFAQIQEQQIDYFSFGTFCQKGRETRDTLYRLLETVKFEKVFCDINIRDWNIKKEIIEKSLEYTDILKLNDEEAFFLSDLFFGKKLTLDETAYSLQKQFQLEAVCITQGEKGCSIYRGQEKAEAPALAVEIKSTVGAGDAFAAAFLKSYSEGKSLKECGENGNRLGGLTASSQETVPEYKIK